MRILFPKTVSFFSQTGKGSEKGARLRLDDSKDSRPCLYWIELNWAGCRQESVEEGGKWLPGGEPRKSGPGGSSGMGNAQQKSLGINTLPCYFVKTRKRQHEHLGPPNGGFSLEKELEKGVLTIWGRLETHPPGFFPFIHDHTGGGGQTAWIHGSGCSGTSTMMPSSSVSLSLLRPEYWGEIAYSPRHARWRGAEFWHPYIYVSLAY